MTTASLRLRNSLALLEGGGVFFLRSPGKRELDAVVTELERGLPALRQEPVHWLPLDPTRGLPEGRLFAGQDELLRAILEPLAAPVIQPPGHNILLVDATLVHCCEDRTWCGLLGHVAEEEAWAWLFRRMNELRNTILKVLRGPLILCLPPKMELLFIDHAPDFWSIRSGHYVFDGLVRPLPPAAPGTLGELTAEAIRQTLRPLGQEPWGTRARQALLLAQEERWSELLIWAEDTVAAFRGRRHYLPPAGSLVALLLCPLLSAFSAGWPEAARRAQAAWPEIGKEAGELDLSYLVPDLELLLGSWASYYQDWATAFEAYFVAFKGRWGQWSGGVGAGLEPSMIQDLLRCCQVLRAMGQPDRCLEFLRSAEDLVDRAPWLLRMEGRELSPSPALLLALSAAYADLGDERRALLYAKRARKEPPQGASPQAP